MLPIIVWKRDPTRQVSEGNLCWVSLSLSLFASLSLSHAVVFPGGIGRWQKDGGNKATKVVVMLNANAPNVGKRHVSAF